MALCTNIPVLVTSSKYADTPFRIKNNPQCFDQCMKMDAIIVLLVFITIYVQ
jgi:hypothetical protein